jgi:hypothetical protein
LKAAFWIPTLFTATFDALTITRTLSHQLGALRLSFGGAAEQSSRLLH